jgi:hypothetical protein
VTPVALMTWLDLIRDDDPDLMVWVGPADHPFRTADDLNAALRADPQAFDGLPSLFIKHDVHRLDEHTVLALVEVVSLHDDSKSSAA